MPCLQHVAKVPEPLHIYMCWPLDWVDPVYLHELTGLQQPRVNLKSRPIQTYVSGKAQRRLIAEDLKQCIGTVRRARNTVLVTIMVS